MPLRMMKSAVAYSQGVDVARRRAGNRLCAAENYGSYQVLRSSNIAQGKFSSMTHKRRMFMRIEPLLL
jgi:hypothetical protein